MNTIEDVKHNYNSGYQNDLDVLLNDDTPPSTLRKLFYKHFDSNMFGVSSAVINHERLPSDVMEHIAKHGSVDVRYLVLGGARFPSLNAIHVLLENDDSEECKAKILEGLTDRSDISKKLAKELQQSSHEILRLIAISNPYITPSGLLQFAATDESKLVRQACAKHEECPSRILNQLALDKDPDVRAAAISNSNLKRSSILKLYSDENDPKVRLSYLKREDCPAKVIEYFFKGEGADDDLRKAIADHVNCPAKILRALADDTVNQVRLSVALNKHTPTISINKLVMDIVPMIRSAAGFHANCPEDRYQQAFKIPDVTYPSDRNNQDLLIKIQAIKDCYTKCIDESEDLVEDLIIGHEKINNISLAWDFEYFIAPPNYVDRTRGMLAGPFYTSQKYPWPRTKQDKLAEPIIQIDLDEASIIRNSSYGTGLLQVFSEDIHLFTRHIPRAEIAAEQLTGCEWDFVVSDGTEFYQFSESPSHLILIRQIIGYKKAYISSDEVDFMNLDNVDIPIAFREMESLLKVAVKKSVGNHLFGAFHEIQSHLCDGELLVALDEDDGYVWGDSGNAQVFVKKDNNEFKYFAQWSCY